MDAKLAERQINLSLFWSSSREVLQTFWTNPIAMSDFSYTFAQKCSSIFLQLIERAKRQKTGIWSFDFNYVRLKNSSGNRIISLDMEEIFTFDPKTVVSFLVSCPLTYL